MRIILAIGPLMFLIACGASGPTVEEDKFSTGLVVQVTERQGVRLSLATPDQVILEGEPVLIQAELTNFSDEPIAYVTGYSGAPAFGVHLDTNFLGWTILLGPQEHVRGDLPIEQAYLEPGQTIRREVVWNRMLDGNIQAPSGTYEIRAIFGIWDEEQELSLPVEVRARIEIEAAESIITPQEAITSALADERLAEWYRGHDEQLHCRLPGGQGVYILRGNVFLVLPGQEIERAPGQAGCSLKLVAFPAWEIELSGSHNVRPKLDKVFVDAIEGTVIVVRPRLN